MRFVGVLGLAGSPGDSPLDCDALRAPTILFWSADILCSDPKAGAVSGTCAKGAAAAFASPMLAPNRFDSCSVLLRERGDVAARAELRWSDAFCS